MSCIKHRPLCGFRKEKKASTRATHSSASSCRISFIKITFSGSAILVAFTVFSYCCLKKNSNKWLFYNYLANTETRNSQSQLEPFCLKITNLVESHWRQLSCPIRRGDGATSGRSSSSSSATNGVWKLTQ